MSSFDLHIRWSYILHSNTLQVEGDSLYSTLKHSSGGRRQVCPSKGLAVAAPSLFYSFSAYYELLQFSCALLSGFIDCTVFNEMNPHDIYVALKETHKEASDWGYTNYSEPKWAQKMARHVSPTPSTSSMLAMFWGKINDNLIWSDISTLLLLKKISKDFFCVCMFVCICTFCSRK